MTEGFHKQASGLLAGEVLLSGNEIPVANGKASPQYEKGKLACALCHGVAILKYAKLSSGEHLARGKTVTGFANVEEDFADNAVWSMNLLPRDKHVMPWRIEDEMRRIGANYVQAGQNSTNFLCNPVALSKVNLGACRPATMMASNFATSMSDAFRVPSIRPASFGVWMKPMLIRS